MPLIKSKSGKAVGKNIKKEMDAGKPHKQAIAIALSVQRKAKKMASGGEAKKPEEQKGGGGALDYTPDQEKVKKMQKAMGFAHGGEVEEDLDDRQEASIAEEIMKRRRLSEVSLDELNEEAAESEEHEMAETPEHEASEHAAEEETDSIKRRIKQIRK